MFPPEPDPKGGERHLVSHRSCNVVSAVDADLYVLVGRSRDLVPRGAEEVVE